VIWSLWVDILKKEIAPEVAGAMMCAILSDTVMFKSPTTVEYDRRAVEELAKIAGINDYEALGMEMLRVKSSIAEDSAMDLLKRDFKDFEVSGKKVGIGQLELVDLTVFDEKKAGVMAEMKKLKVDGGYWGVIMLITDVMREGSLVLVDSGENARVGEILGGDLSSGEGWIDGIMSRKKQVAAPLSEKL
jgi:manganese-dependent inorganic pyrophosphatase